MPQTLIIKIIKDGNRKNDLCAALANLIAKQSLDLFTYSNGDSFHCFEMLRQMIWFILVFVVIVFLVGAPRVTVKSHWHRQFDGIQFSTQGFYEEVTANILSRSIPGVYFSRVTRREGGLFSANRECLRIVYKSTVHDICASHFGNGSYVSWWHMEEEWHLLEKAPKDGSFENLRRRKSNSQIDLEQVFTETIRSAVTQTIEGLTNSQGRRNFRT